MQKGNKIMLVVGIIVLGIGAYVLSRELAFRKNAVETNGTVISTLGSTFTVQYITNDGIEKTKRFSVKTNTNRAGDAKQIWYLPDNPEKASLTNGTEGGRVLILSGLVCLALGIYPLFQKKRISTSAW
jgi:hypothetical protein